VTIEDLALLIFAVILCLCGILTLVWMFTYAFLKRERRNPLRRTLVFFGLLGLLIPAVGVLWSLTNAVPPASVSYLWPTEYVLGAGEYGDPVWYVVMVFSVAIVSNVGAYGVVGFFVGWAWSRMRTKKMHDASAH
jgi:hypothetical protein